MLYLYFDSLDNLCERDGFIYNPSAYFDSIYEREWLQDPLIREAITTVDEVPLGEDTFESLLRAGLRPEDLSTGTKNLVLCKFFDGMNRLSSMGENCFPFLGRISLERDVCMGCSIGFYIDEDFFDICPIHIVNSDKTYTTWTEWWDSGLWFDFL